MAEAMCAAAIGCRAWDRGEGLTAGSPKGAGGKATLMHKGQSTLALLGWAVSPSSLTTSFMTPPLAQTMSIDLGDTNGEAMATPSAKANHPSTKRVRKRA